MSHLHLRQVQVLRAVGAKQSPNFEEIASSAWSRYEREEHPLYSTSASSQRHDSDYRFNVRYFTQCGVKSLPNFFIIAVS